MSAILSGGDAATWEKGQAKLKELKPSFKAFYTNDANSQQLIANGETPVQVILSMNAHFMAARACPFKLVIPKEGAVLGIDTVAIMKGSKKADLAYKFINVALDPQVQAEVAKFKKGSPVVLDAKIDPAVAKLPGVFTTRRSVEQAGDHHRSQAARRENRGMAQMVCREHHELTSVRFGTAVHPRTRAIDVDLSGGPLTIRRRSTHPRSLRSGGHLPFREVSRRAREPYAACGTA